MSRSGPAGYREDADIDDELRAAQDRLDDVSDNVDLLDFDFKSNYWLEITHFHSIVLFIGF